MAIRIHCLLNIQIKFISKLGVFSFSKILHFEIQLGRQFRIKKIFVSLRELGLY